MDGGNLAVIGVEQLLLNAVHGGIQLGVADGALLAGAQHAVQQLLAVKDLAGASFFTTISGTVSTIS